MYTLCWSAKGGSGTSVVAAALALRSNGLLVDFGGDAPAVLGIPEPDGPGVTDWLEADESVGRVALERLISPAGLGMADVVSRGHGQPHERRWEVLASVLGELASDRSVIVDVGVDMDAGVRLALNAGQSLLVVRQCYLALRRAALSPIRPSGIVVIKEPNRALSISEIERVAGAPVVAIVPLDPAIARSVDSGLLSARLPRTLSTALRRAA